MYSRAFPYQESKKYPFNEKSTFYITNEITFPYEFLADAHIYTTNNTPYELTRIVKDKKKVIFSIGTFSNRDQITGTYFFNTTKTNVIDLFDVHTRCAGMFVIAIPHLIEFLPDGDYDLNPGTAIFEVSCHIPMKLTGVTGFVVNDELASGDVQFIGTQGVAIVKEDNEITFNFVGEPYWNKWKRAEKNEYMSDNYLQFLHIVVDNPAFGYEQELILLPDENGNILLSSNNIFLLNSALRLSGKESNLILSLAKSR
jgi:hypothetical protein